MRMVTSKHMLKLYAISENTSIVCAKKKLENIIKTKCETLTFELAKNFNNDPLKSVREESGLNLRRMIESLTGN